MIDDGSGRMTDARNNQLTWGRPWDRSARWACSTKVEPKADVPRRWSATSFHWPWLRLAGRGSIWTRRNPWLASQSRAVSEWTDGRDRLSADQSRTHPKRAWSNSGNTLRTLGWILLFIVTGQPWKYQEGWCGWINKWATDDRLWERIPVFQGKGVGGFGTGPRFTPLWNRNGRDGMRSKWYEDDDGCFFFLMTTTLTTATISLDPLMMGLSWTALPDAFKTTLPNPILKPGPMLSCCCKVNLMPPHQNAKGEWENSHFSALVLREHFTK